MDEITQIISTVGFPIAAYLLVFFYMKEQMKTHKEETDQLKSVIAENTVMLSKLAQLIQDKVG